MFGEPRLEVAMARTNSKHSRDHRSCDHEESHHADDAYWSHLDVDLTELPAVYAFFDDSAEQQVVSGHLRAEDFLYELARAEDFLLNDPREMRMPADKMSICPNETLESLTTGSFRHSVGKDPLYGCDILLEDRAIEPLFVAEIIMDHSQVDVGGGCDIAHGGWRESLFREESRAFFEN